MTPDSDRNDSASVLATFAVGFGVVLFSIAANSLLVSVPVMWLWNAFVPAVLGLRSLTWTQALWLSVLCGILLRPGHSQIMQN